MCNHIISHRPLYQFGFETSLFLTGFGHRNLIMWKALLETWGETPVVSCWLDHRDPSVQWNREKKQEWNDKCRGTGWEIYVCCELMCNDVSDSIYMFSQGTWFWHGRLHAEPSILLWHCGSEVNIRTPLSAWPHSSRQFHGCSRYFLQICRWCSHSTK